MKHTLTICNRQQAHAVNLRLFRQIVQTLLEDLLTVERYDLGVVIVATQEMTRLNETFLHHAGSTDVITFDYSVGDPRPNRLKAERRAESPALHGEIFVCVDEAAAQARRFHTSWKSELVRYGVHGMLHLFGYDDAKPAARRKMKRQEDRLHRLLAERFEFGKLGV